MATISVNQYNDDGTTSRTAGEVLTISGGILTQRTDTRWHATAPASYTGTYGGNAVISATLGGGFVVDSRNVRWLAITGGSGTPAIGNTISQGGVSGYYLGFWSSLTAQPTLAIGATGFIKLREVTGGAFSAGALTFSGAGAATAAGADVQGWIEVVMDQAGNFNVPRLGKFEVRGGWFELGTTTGSAGQIVQTPTNGGGALTECPGVWIEEINIAITGATWSSGVATFTTTSAHGLITKMGAVVEGVTPSGYNTEQKVTVIDSTHFSMPITANPGTYSSGGFLLQFEFYPALKTTTGFITGNLGTDLRSRFVQNMGSGQVRIGSDGTSSIGYVPASGKRIRIPSNIFRQCATGTRATNAAPHTTIATRPDFTTTNAGVIDIEFFYGDWYMLFSQPYSMKLWHVATFDATNISECATALDLWDGITGMSANLDIRSLTLTSNFASGEITEWGGPRGNAAGTTDHDCEVSYCIGQTFNHCRAGIITYARSTGQPWYVNQSTNITLNYCRATNGGVLVNTSFNTVITNHDHVDRYRLATITTTPYYAIQFTNSCVGAMVNGMSFGIRGTIADVHPYNGCVSSLASSDIYIRNLGTRTAFLNGGSVNNPAYIFGDLGNNVNIRVQRCYMTPTRTGAHSSVNSSKNILFEDVYGDFADAITSAGLNMLVRGGGGTNGVTGQASVYGTHWGGAFTSDTVGRIWLNLNEPTTDTLQYTSRSFSAGSGFTSAGGLSLATLNDYFICEMQVFKKQHTAFQNAAPTLTGTNTGNHSYEYQIDTGSGWNGSWKTLDGTNLSGETITPSTGFKLKLKITCTTAAATNLISFVRVLTDSTLSDQVNNLYPLDTATLTLTGISTGSDIVIYAAGTTTVRQNTDSISGTTNAYIYETPENIDIGIFKAGYIPFYIRNYSLGTDNASLPIAQVVDRAYLD